MKLDQIIQGLEKLLIKNNYSPQTIKFYKREWKKLELFLIDNYSSTEFSLDKGLAYLEKQYGIVSKYIDGTISQQRVQLLRVIHLLSDYQLHGVLTRRYTASRNQIHLSDEYAVIFNEFLNYLKENELSYSTIKHYSHISKVFLDYLSQKQVTDIFTIDLAICNSFIKTFSNFSFKTVEQNICGLRYFLRYLHFKNKLTVDLASKIHMPAISKTRSIPSVWTAEELTQLLKAIDRNSPLGKRDYAMILLACILGIRSSDIKNLKFDNFDWENKRISFIQHKTKKPLSLPLPNEVGWAVIDYIRNGRPTFYDTHYIFIKHMPPFDPFSEGNHLNDIIRRYMNKAKIPATKNRHSGFHSMRHAAASLLLEAGTPLPIITEILGHSNPDITSIYLKTDINKLKECVLPLSFDDETFNIQ